MAIESWRSSFVANHNDPAMIFCTIFLVCPYTVGGDRDESSYCLERSWNLMPHQRSDACQQ